MGTGSSLPSLLYSAGGKLKDPFCCTKVEQTESHEPPMTELSARRKQIPVYRENARRAQTNVIGERGSVEVCRELDPEARKPQVCVFI